MQLSCLEHRTGTPLTQVRFSGGCKGFLPRVNFQCILFLGVRTPPCVIACINISTHDKYPVVHVRVRWIRAIQAYPARTIRDKNNQLGDYGREGRWGTKDDFATRFLYFLLFSTALWDLPKSWPDHSLMSSSHLFLSLSYLLPPFTVPCKMILARPDERET